MDEVETVKDFVAQLKSHAGSDEATILLLIFRRKEKNAIDLQDALGRTALMYMARDGYNNLTKFMINEGEADVNIKDNNGDTALILATRSKYNNCVQCIIDYGQSCINIANNNGNTAIMSACLNGNVKSVKLLLDKGHADVNIKNNDDQTALLLAATNGEEECVKLLINSDQINIHIFDNDDDVDTKNTFLLMIIAGNLGQIQNLLLNETINVKDFHIRGGKTPLMLSALYGHVECVKYFCEYEGINVNKREKNKQRTSLMFAALNGYKECLRVLIETGRADADKKDLFGNTAIMLAAMNGHLECVKYLMSTGEVNIYNQNTLNGYTAHMFALKNGYFNCFEFLIGSSSIGKIFILSVMTGDIKIIRLFLQETKKDINNKELSEIISLELVVDKHGHLNFDIHDVERNQMLNHNPNIINRGLLYILILSLVDGNVEFFMDLVTSCCDLTSNHYREKPYFTSHNDEEESDFLMTAKTAIARNCEYSFNLLMKYVSKKDTTSKDTRTLFRYVMHDSIRRKWFLPRLLQHQLFEWCWYVDADITDDKRRSLVRELIISGYSPGYFQYNGKMCSPLIHTLTMGGVDSFGLVRYLIANLYLTQHDLFYYDEILHDDHVPERESRTPWRLEVLSLLTISKSLTDKNRKMEYNYSRRAMDLDSLPIPEVFRMRLSFQSPIRNLCITQWHTISLQFLNRRLSILDVNDNDREIIQRNCCSGGCERFNEENCTLPDWPCSRGRNEFF